MYESDREFHLSTILSLTKNFQTSSLHLFLNSFFSVNLWRDWDTIMEQSQNLANQNIWFGLFWAMIEMVDLQMI